MKKLFLTLLLVGCGDATQCLNSTVDIFCKGTYGYTCKDLDTNDLKQIQTFKVCNTNQAILNRYFMPNSFVSYDLDHKVIGAVVGCYVYGTPCIPY